MAIACPADGIGGRVCDGWVRKTARNGVNLVSRETQMAIDPSAIGAATDPVLFEWTDRDTLLYALGVGAGLNDLSFTTENSHDVPQQVLPTYAVICCPAFGAAPRSERSTGPCCYTAPRRSAACAAAGRGKLSVVTEVADLQDKARARTHRGTARPRHGSGIRDVDRRDVDHAGDPPGGRIRGVPGERLGTGFPDREPDARVALPTRADQALIYRCPATQPAAQ